MESIAEADKMQIINLWLNHNYKRDEIKAIMQVPGIVVERTINEYAETGAHEPPAGMVPPERAMMIKRRGRKVVVLDAGN